MVIFLWVYLILVASLGSIKDEGCSFIFEMDNAAKLQVRQVFLRYVCASSGKSLRSPAGGPPTMLCRQAIPFLISITGLTHLPHLPDQAVCDFHLIIGLCKTLIQLSTPSQLYSISIFQFLAERIGMKMCKIVRKSFMCVNESKPHNVTDSISPLVKLLVSN